MRSHERFALVMALGTITAYAVGLVTSRLLGAFWAGVLVPAVELLAIYLGWFWAQSRRSS